MSGERVPPWCVVAMYDGVGRAVCDRCGGQERIPLPLTVDAFSAWAVYFGVRHRDCGLDLGNVRLPPPIERRSIRLANGLTQDDLAGVLGVTRFTILRWEQGTRRPSSRAARKYADLLDSLRRKQEAARPT